MIRINFKGILILFIILHSSCSSIDSKNESNRKSVEQYYKDSQALSGEGEMKNNLKSGEWIEYYADGVIKWEGVYKNGIRDYASVDVTGGNCYLDIKGEPDSLRLNKEYYLRVVTDKIHPDDLVVAMSKGVVMDIEDETYDYVFTPIKKGVMRIYISYFDNGSQVDKCIFEFDIYD